MKICLRAATNDDLKGYQELAQEAPIGFTTLAKDPKILAENLAHSCRSFQKDVETPNDEFYLFVAEDVETKKLLGVAAIAATTGGKAPLYYFRKDFESSESQVDAVVREVPILTPVSYARGPTELCSLFVPQKHRKSGVGRLLSLGRFLYIKAHDSRFTNTLFAELRGRVSNDKTSPFWDGVGRHFFSKSYSELLDMLQYGKGFIADFLPKHPIYTDLLPKEVQACIEEVDAHTEGAYKMLQNLGFTKSGEVDVLDAGPRMITTKEELMLLQQAKKCIVSTLQEVPSANNGYMISTCAKDFRACYAHCLIEDGRITLSKQTAEMLRVGLHDPVICYRWKSL